MVDNLNSYSNVKSNSDNDISSSKASDNSKSSNNDKDSYNRNRISSNHYADVTSEENDDNNTDIVFKLISTPYFINCQYLAEGLEKVRVKCMLAVY